MAKKNKKKMQVDHKEDVFYSNGFSVNVNDNGDLIIDFRQSLPRTDITPDKTVINTISVKHRPVVLRPDHLKMLVEVLNENLEDIEEKHGEIELPEKWRVKGSSEQEIDEETVSDSTSKYIG